jgi:hypothetical protein
MNHLIVFIRLTGLQFAISKFDIRRIEEVPCDSGSCDLYHYTDDERDNTECVRVLGDFKTLVTRVNSPDGPSNNSDDWWKQ